MKNRILHIGFVLVCAPMFGYGAPPGPIPWERIELKRTLAPEERGICVDFSVVQCGGAIGETVKGQWLNTFLVEQFVAAGKMQPPGVQEASRVLTRLADTLTQEYLDLLVSFPKYRSVWTYERNIAPTYESAELLIFIHEEWSYTGGAHGNGTSKPLWIDVEKMRQIPHKDLFDPERVEDLQALITERFLRRPDADKVLYDSLKGKKLPLGLPTLTEDGVRFLYNPYVIAPYSAGIVAVDVPKEALKGILNPALPWPKGWVDGTAVR